MGLFAGSGVGKSVLLGMMTRGSVADVVVVGLIGERGREVKEFIEEILGAEGRERAVVVAAPADASPLMRLKGCETALAIAEYFREQGLNVLLLMDSPHPLRPGTAGNCTGGGEPPATKGYPPRCLPNCRRWWSGPATAATARAPSPPFHRADGGDDLQDPIADAARAILDGHIVLARELADAGHHPAIDIEKSISRVMPMVTSPEHMELARTFKQFYSLSTSRTGISSPSAPTARIGSAHRPGHHPETLSGSVLAAENARGHSLR